MQGAWGGDEIELHFFPAEALQRHHNASFAARVLNHGSGSLVDLCLGQPRRETMPHTVCPRGSVARSVSAPPDYSGKSIDFPGPAVLSFFT
jgi:hypothetical protein